MSYAFSHEETATFLQQALPFAPAPETLARLEAHLEGWVAGLRLLALALQNRSDPQEIEQVLAAFTGGHRYLHDYFAGEVLGSQSETLQSFLLQTSILSRMCPSLCDAVTGEMIARRSWKLLSARASFCNRLTAPDRGIAIICSLPRLCGPRLSDNLGRRPCSWV